jgi:hypothetical protein
MVKNLRRTAISNAPSGEQQKGSKAARQCRTKSGLAAMVMIAAKHAARKRNCRSGYRFAGAPAKRATTRVAPTGIDMT